MSHQCLADAFAPADAAYKHAVMKETWGHLAPKRNRAYKGFVVFALGCFECGDLNPTPLECEFGSLDSSPWFYDALIEFLQSLNGETGGVYRWDGTFKNYEFIGTVRRMSVR